MTDPAHPPATLTVIDHPLLRDRLTELRAETTPFPRFREVLQQAAKLIAVDATRDLETSATTVHTPLCETSGERLIRDQVLVPILRAGVGLLDGFMEILPHAAVGYIGMARDEATFQPHAYLCSLPEGLDEAEVFMLDPMLATGGSAIAAASQLKEAGAHRIRFACLLAAPEGIEAFATAHPDIPIITAAVDERLDERAFIVPGLGDAGDRYFGT